MALQGVGLAWIPDFCIREELANGKLVRAAGESWDIPLEIRPTAARWCTSRASEEAVEGA